MVGRLPETPAMDVAGTLWSISHKQEPRQSSQEQSQQKLRRQFTGSSSYSVLSQSRDSQTQPSSY